MSGPPHIPPNIQEFAAPQLLGGVWNWCLYGALVVQFYVYNYNFSRDNRYMKLLVYGIFFLETAQTALSAVDLCYWFPTGQNTPLFTTFLDVPMMGSVVSLSVQFFFVYRIFKLSEKRSWWLCVIICLLSVVGASAAFIAGILSYLLGDLNPVVLVMVWLIASTLSDLLIVSAMLYHLRRVWAKDGNLSRHILVKIVRLTIETNLVTTTVSFVTLLFLGLYPDWTWYMCPAYILGKLYSNTLLVSLNNRISIRDSNDARGAVVDRQVWMCLTCSAHPEAAAGTEKPQNDCMNESIEETEVEERVNTPATKPVMSSLRRNRH